MTVAAWFHDIMNGIDNHDFEGAEKTGILLSSHCSEYEANEICDIIRRHDDRYSNREDFSVYAKIHQDADHLDHFGTYDVWMRCLYAVAHGETIIDAIHEIKEWYKEIDGKYAN